MSTDNITICGPPCVGKTTAGRALAERLGRAFVDMDVWIEVRHGRPVPDYFEAGEKALFREREALACRVLAARSRQVIAVGGGALLDPHSRAALEATGPVICLRASPEVLLARLGDGPERPLLAGERAQKLRALLGARAAHYDSFPLAVDTDRQPVEDTVAEVAQLVRAEAGLTRFYLNGSRARIRGARMHGARYGQGLLAGLTESGLQPPLVVISDSNVAPLYGERVGAILGAPVVSFPAGEAHKTLDTVRVLYEACLAHGMERGGTILAVGGGVVGDVAGFVAATLMRGVRWVNLPTTVLAMADAALGGKVGVDLPAGKNLVGAFHLPALVLADFDTLATLPEAERRAGMAEVLKAGVIGDASLFEGLASGDMELAMAIRRAAGVKVGIVNADPLERGERARLNFGHTLGHGIEAASGYRLRHGEAVGVGMIAEARLAERVGLAPVGLGEVLREAVQTLGLPTRARVPSIEGVFRAMSKDKKKAAGRLKFALPSRIGKVREGIDVPDERVVEVLAEIVEVA